MKTICYLHGAMSTSMGFEHICQNLPKHKSILVNYDYNIKLKDALKDIIKTISSNLDSPNDEIQIIAHSLGGILALNLVDSDIFEVGKVVTISTPFGGSEAAVYMSLLHPFTSLYREISPNSGYLSATKKLVYKGSVADMIATDRLLPIVTYVTEGILHKTENDNVVTTKSQFELDGPKYATLNYNHFEVLQAPEAIKMIKSFVFTQK